MGKIQAYMDDSIVRAVEELARADRRTISGYVEKVLADHLKMLGLLGHTQVDIHRKKEEEVSSNQNPSR